MRRSALVLVFGLMAAPTAGQERLTLPDVVARAKTVTPSVRAAEAVERAAAARVTTTRAGLLPRAELAETWQRGNQPVFVFGSRLGQRRFAEADFAIDALNRPSAINNVRTSLLVSQPVYDGGMARSALRSSQLQRDAASLARERTAQDGALTAVRAFARVVQLDAAYRAAMTAVEAAESDLDRARNRRDLGLATEADVLAIEVHEADMRQRVIAADGERRVARFELNAAIGRDLDAPVDLEVPGPPPAPAASSTELEQLALATRPETREAATASSLASEGVRSAKAVFLPRVDAMLGWELNGGSFTSGASSWIGGVEVKLNLFNGLSDRARVVEAEEARRRAQAEREQTETAVRVEVRSAVARVESARARDGVAQAAVASAREAQRIVRDRYEYGLVNVADVLRAAQAVLDAESHASEARAELLLQAATLDRAVGRL